MVFGLSHLLSIHFISLLSKFQNLSSYCRENAEKPHSRPRVDHVFVHICMITDNLFKRVEKPLKKYTKIVHLWVKFSPWRRRVGKNLMNRSRKQIFCRFWILNHIFGSIYGSRDIERSLVTTLAVFGQTWPLWMTISWGNFFLTCGFL